MEVPSGKLAVTITINESQYILQHKVWQSVFLNLDREIYKELEN